MAHALSRVLQGGAEFPRCMQGCAQAPPCVPGEVAEALSVCGEGPWPFGMFRDMHGSMHMCRDLPGAFCVQASLGISPAEPSFVHADLIRENPDSAEGEDDRIYFFFTEVSVEYEFVFKLVIPRVARVCKVRPFPHFSSVPPLGTVHLKD